MKRLHRTDLLLLAVVALACWAMPRRPSAPGPDWHLDVRVADIRVSIGSDAAPVRDRTLLSGIGQIVLGLAR